MKLDRAGDSMRSPDGGGALSLGLGVLRIVDAQDLAMVRSGRDVNRRRSFSHGLLAGKAYTSIT